VAYTLEDEGPTSEEDQKNIIILQSKLQFRPALQSTRYDNQQVLSSEEKPSHLRLSAYIHN